MREREAPQADRTKAGGATSHPPGLDHGAHANGRGLRRERERLERSSRPRDSGHKQTTDHRTPQAPRSFDRITTAGPESAAIGTRRTTQRDATGASVVRPNYNGGSRERSERDTTHHASRRYGRHVQSFRPRLAHIHAIPAHAIPDNDIPAYSSHPQDGEYSLNFRAAAVAFAAASSERSPGAVARESPGPVIVDPGRSCEVGFSPIGGFSSQSGLTCRVRLIWRSRSRPGRAVKKRLDV